MSAPEQDELDRLWQIRIHEAFAICNDVHEFWDCLGSALPQLEPPDSVKVGIDQTLGALGFAAIAI